MKATSNLRPPHPKVPTDHFWGCVGGCYNAARLPGQSSQLCLTFLVLEVCKFTTFCDWKGYTQQQKVLDFSQFSTGVRMHGHQAFFPLIFHGRHWTAPFDANSASPPYPPNICTPRKRAHCISTSTKENCFLLCGDHWKRTNGHTTVVVRLQCIVGCRVHIEISGQTLGFSFSVWFHKTLFLIMSSIPVTFTAISFSAWPSVLLFTYIINAETVISCFQLYNYTIV